eukprot:gene17276-biopygen7648
MEKPCGQKLSTGLFHTRGFYELGTDAFPCSDRKVGRWKIMGIYEVRGSGEPGDRGRRGPGVGSRELGRTGRSEPSTARPARPPGAVRRPTDLGSTHDGGPRDAPQLEWGGAVRLVGHLRSHLSQSKQIRTFSLFFNFPAISPHPRSAVCLPAGSPLET